ncbi:MAG: ferritin-like domain-containing protein [Ferruginibacter sp.]
MATTSKKAPVKKTGDKPTTNTGKMQDSEFHKFFVEELQDIYWAEKALVKALPKMQKAATSPELIEAFKKHTGETQTHVSTLEQVFTLLDEKPKAKKCDAMAGLLEEATSIMEDTKKGSMTRDAGLILAAQKVEHYEIGTYGTLRTFAECMGHTDIQSLLQQTLDNEKATDEALTKVAEGSINSPASAE